MAAAPRLQPAGDEGPERTSGRRGEDGSLALHLEDPSRGVTEITLSRTASGRESLRLEFEHLVDSYIEELQPAELREVLLLRDYFGASWAEIRTALRRASDEEAIALYREAHERLRRRMRPHLEKRGREE